MRVLVTVAVGVLAFAGLARGADPQAKAPPPAAAEKRIRVTPGTVLRAAPDRSAPRVATVSAVSLLRELDRQGSWVQVEYFQQTGWFAVGVVEEEPPLGTAAEPTRPLPARPPDPERLARARKLLNTSAQAARLGPYTLYTDVADLERLAFLGRLAAQVEEAYRERYGRTPIGEPAEAVVYFSGEEGYRKAQGEHAELAGLAGSGHTGYGIVAIFDGGRGGREIASSLVHELTHLLNRRALGPVLPSWLDEGIADDLSQGRIDETGRLFPAELGGVVIRAGGRVQMFGARAALRQLAEAQAAGGARPLPALLSLAWSDFVRDGGELNYAQSAFWVRYLVAGEGGALAPGFRAFLDGIAEGGDAGGEALRAKLGRSWEELEAGFAAWVRALEAG